MHGTTGRAGVGAIKMSSSGAASAGVLQQAGTQVAQAIDMEVDPQNHYVAYGLEIEDGDPRVKERELPCNVLLSKIHRWLHDFETRRSWQMLIFTISVC